MIPHDIDDTMKDLLGIDYKSIVPDKFYVYSNVGKRGEFLAGPLESYTEAEYYRDDINPKFAVHPPTIMTSIETIRFLSQVFSTGLAY